MNLVTKGLVIKETNIGEADRLITVITEDNGLVKAYASGAKSIKSKRGSGTGLLSYSSFCFSKKGSTLRVTEATPIKIFFGAGDDIGVLSLSQYFCEMCLVFEPSGQNKNEFLRTVLNSLYFLTEKKKDLYLIKAITELRIAAISGFLPNLIACDTCGRFEDERMFFDLANGNIYCSSCNENGDNMPINKTVLSAMRHIVYSEFSKLYSFSVPQTDAKYLSGITEKYILKKTEQNFKTLNFFNSIKDGLQ